MHLSGRAPADRRRALRLALTLGLACASAIASPDAYAAISVTSGVDTVSTSNLVLDFGDAPGNVERVDSLRWRDSGGVLGGNLVVNGDAACAGFAGDPGSQWAQAAGDTDGLPAPVGSGTAGSWTPRGGRSVEIVSSRAKSCTSDTVATGVRTRYSFFDVGGAASKVRVERTFSFGAGTPNYFAVGMRPYVPHLPTSYSQVIHPNAAGTGLVTDDPASCGGAEGCATTNWNKTWLAIDNPTTHAGMVILRDPGNTNDAKIWLQDLATNAPANVSAVDLVRPNLGWHAPLKETEFLCFYDATSWPVMQRSATNLPSLCSVVPVPINDTPPSIGGTARVASTLTANPGTWDYATGSFSYQWLRCPGGGCTPIAGATGSSYTATDADEGKQLRVDVTATASGGQTDTASAITEGVKPGPPTSTAPPTVTGEARVLETLTGSTGSWTGSPGTFLYQWRRCATATGTSCADVAGATGATYKLAPADVGSTMRLRVQATNSQGTTAADSAATAVVQPEILAARLQISPETSCTGLPVRFDGSGSTTPNGPIVRYQLTFRQFPIGILVLGFFGADLNQLVTQFPLHTLSDSSAAVLDTTFTWNRQIDHDESPGHKGDYARDAMLVTLTVTDRAGARASTDTVLAFIQNYSSESRAGCPKPLSAHAFVAIAKVNDAKVIAGAFRGSIPCKSSIACAGRVEVFPRPTRRRRHPKRAAKERQAAATPVVVLAKSPLFNIPAHKSRSVSAKLTKAGRKRLRPGRRVRVTIQITSVTPAGRTVTRSVPATLRRRR